MAVSTRPAPFVRSFSFDADEQRVAGGSAVVVAPSGGEPPCPLASASDSDDFGWSDAQTAAFLAGGPLTLGWVTQSPGQRGRESVYVCCWISIDLD
jgi:hypothetical protein